MTRRIATEWVFEIFGDDEDFVPYEADVTVTKNNISVYCEHTKHRRDITYDDFSYLLQHPDEDYKGAKLKTTSVTCEGNAKLVYTLELTDFSIPLPELQQLIRDMKGE